MPTDVMPKRARLLLAAGLAVSLAACTTYSRLEPAPGAQPANGDAAVASMDGIEVTVATDALTDRLSVRRHTTPLKVTIDNDSDRPVTLRYQDFSLVGEGGQVYSALPPFQIDGTVRERRATVVGHPIYRSPAFTYDRFYVSPYYAHFYPTLSPFRGRFTYDPFYYDRHYTVWEEVDLPTEDMLRKALPEGVIEPGGSVTGLLYFQPVTQETGPVDFRFDLVDSEDADVFGALTIPLEMRQD